MSNPRSLIPRTEGQAYLPRQPGTHRWASPSWNESTIVDGSTVLSGREGPLAAEDELLGPPELGSRDVRWEREQGGPGLGRIPRPGRRRGSPASGRRESRSGRGRSSVRASGGPLRRASLRVRRDAPQPRAARISLRRASVNFDGVGTIRSSAAQVVNRPYYPVPTKRSRRGADRDWEIMCAAGGARDG